VLKPSIVGSFIYLFTNNIDEVLSKAVELGSEILFEKTDAGNCFVAEIKDSEGNRICFTTRHHKPSNKLIYQGKHGMIEMWVVDSGPTKDTKSKQ
jgi:hypothetical protein